MREWVENLRPEQRDFLRALGGLALMAATLTLFIRKTQHDDWGDFGRLLVLLIPCGLLYLLGLGVGDRELARDARPAVDRGLLVRARRVAPAWQTVLVVLAVILVPFVLLQFIELVGGNTSDSLNTAWVFLVTAALALYAAFGTGVRYASLLAAIALVVSWVALCDKLFDPSATAIRWILLVAAAGLVVAAVQLERVEVPQAPEFVTAAGLAALIAGLLGLFASAVGFVGNSFFRVIGSRPTQFGGPHQHLEWDVSLLLLAVLLIWYGSRRGVRGPTYVGALALTGFVVSVGIELARIFGGDQAEGSLFGWPLLLLLVGVGALVAGFWSPPAESSAEPSPPAQPTAPAA